MQDNWPSVLFAMVGGVVLSLGNLSTQYAWAFVGLSVTEVITSSITVVIGPHFSPRINGTWSWNFLILVNLVLIEQAQPWITSWMTRSTELKFFSRVSVASWLLFVSDQLFTHQMLQIIKQNLKSISCSIRFDNEPYTNFVTFKAFIVPMYIRCYICSIFQGWIFLHIQWGNHKWGYKALVYLTLLLAAHFLFWDSFY